jgi:hypothetical protein
MVVWVVASGGELVVIVDDAVELRVRYKFAAEDWDGVRAALLSEGCVERQIIEALNSLKTTNTVTMAVSTER